MTGRATGIFSSRSENCLTSFGIFSEYCSGVEEEGRTVSSWDRITRLYRDVEFDDGSAPSSSNRKK